MLEIICDTDYFLFLVVPHFGILPRERYSEPSNVQCSSRSNFWIHFCHTNFKNCLANNGGSIPTWSESPGYMGMKVQVDRNLEERTWFQH
jgi:hypothetical protein